MRMLYFASSVLCLWACRGPSTINEAPCKPATSTTSGLVTPSTTSETGSTTTTTTTPGGWSSVPFNVVDWGATREYAEPIAWDNNGLPSCDRIWLTPIGSQQQLINEYAAKLNTSAQDVPAGLDYVNDRVWFAWTPHCTESYRPIWVDAVWERDGEMRVDLAIWDQHGTLSITPQRGFAVFTTPAPAPATITWRQGHVVGLMP